MGRCILTTGRIAEKPYRIRVIDRNVYTVEELCYSIAQCASFLDEDFMDWALIADGGLADYPTDTNLCTVPASAVAAAGNARFGTSRQPEYKTIGFTDLLRFYYDADQQCYLLPADPRFFGNLPEIETCSRTSDGLYAVSAVYRPEQPVWYQTEAPVVRHAELTMRQDADSWQILSLKTDAPEPDAEASEETND